MSRVSVTFSKRGGAGTTVLCAPQPAGLRPRTGGLTPPRSEVSTLNELG